MRSVRSLSSIAGPGASLAQAGFCVAGGGGGYVLGNSFIDGVYANIDVSINVSDWGIQPGDLLIATLQSSANFGNASNGTYGKTEVRGGGWTELHMKSHFGVVLYKVADGSETLVTAGAVSHGGMSLVALRGLKLPDVIASNNVGATTSSTPAVPGFGGVVGVDYDFLLSFACCGTFGQKFSYVVTGDDVELLSYHQSYTNRANACTLLLGGGNPGKSGGAFIDNSNFYGVTVFHVGLFKE